MGDDAVGGQNIGKLLIVNGSPRAPKSNSKKYIEMFQRHWGQESEVYPVTSGEHECICREIGKYDELLLAFPLYVDALPVPLMDFLKELAHTGLSPELRVHVMVNCGFLEPEQNRMAVEIIRCFCEANRVSYGMTLCIGSGEAILNTPFVSFVDKKMKKFASGMTAGRTDTLKVSMPLPKRLFIRASTGYWKAYGEKYHAGVEEMNSDKIEE